MRKITIALTAFLFSTCIYAQDMWKYFTPDDFAAIRAKVMEQIGDGIAILQGAALPEAFVKFRQDNNFYYLTGVEMPKCVLLLNGKTKNAVLFVPDDVPGDLKAEAKEANFINKIKERFPAVVIKDLTPILDNMRWVKDDKEVAVLRECGKIGAHGFDEAMRVQARRL